MPVRFFLSSFGNVHRLNNLLSFLALLIRVFQTTIFLPCRAAEWRYNAKVPFTLASGGFYACAIFPLFVRKRTSAK